VWSISDEYFIYKPEGKDDNADCFHITNLKKQNATMLIPDTFLKQKSSNPYTHLLYY